MRFVPVRRRPRPDSSANGVGGPGERGYLFDTDLVAALLRKDPDTAVVRRVAAVPTNAQFICAITLGELLSGLPVAEHPELLLRLQELSHVVPVLPFDEASARTLGQLRQRMASDLTGPTGGRSPSDRDLQVAAIALSNGLVLATGDATPYAGLVGLSVEQWIA